MLVLKDVLKPRLKPGSSGGGKSSNQTSTLQTETCTIQVRESKVVNVAYNLFISLP